MTALVATSTAEAVKSTEFPGLVGLAVEPVYSVLPSRMHQLTGT
jgi:hypothetical protein